MKINENAEMKKQKRDERIAVGAGSLAGVAVGVGAATVLNNESEAGTILPDPEPINNNVDYSAQKSHSNTPHVSNTTEEHTTINNVEITVENTGSDSQEGAQQSGLSAYTGGEEIEVLSYATIQNPDGSKMDIAVVSVEGSPVIFGDTDGDGLINIVAHDADGNGVINEKEATDISHEKLSMAPLREAAASVDITYIEESETDPVDVAISDENSDYIARADAEEEYVPGVEDADCYAMGSCDTDCGFNDPLGATDNTDYINDANVDDYMA